MRRDLIEGSLRVVVAAVNAVIYATIVRILSLNSDELIRAALF